MRKWHCLGALVLFAFSFSCEAQEMKYSNVPFLELSGKKIYLRYSKREDVEKLLGKPGVQEHFKMGGEDFDWNDFDVGFYDEKTLSFHYASDGWVIRITVNSSNPRNVRILFGDMKTITSRLIVAAVGRSGDKTAVVNEDFISYMNKDAESNNIISSFWINGSRRIQWYDAYYENQWK